MKKRIISVLLALSMLFALCIPAFAADDRTYRKYQNYVCIGDSIAAGCGLSRDGNETSFDREFESVDEINEAYSDKYLYRGYDFGIVPNAYHSIVAETLGSSLHQCARSGLRSVEFRYFLDGVYNDFDTSMMWGKIFFGDDFVGTYDEDLDVFSQLEKMAKKTDIVNTIKNADLISINLGSNDVMSYSMLVILDDLTSETSIPVLSAVGDFLKETGNIGAAFNMLIDACETLGKTTVILTKLLDALQKTMAQFEENYDAMLKAIYKLNPDVTVASYGMYNPMKNAYIASDSVINLGLIMAPVVIKLNTFIASYNSMPNYYYVDVSDTETYRMDLDDPNIMSLFIVKVHPTLAGHAYMAQQILSVLPDGVGSTYLTAANRSSDGKIKLSWDSVDGAKSYNVYRATSKSGTYKCIGSTSKTSYIDSSANPGVKYYYKLTAVKGSVEGSLSNCVSCRYGCVAPSSVTGSNNASTGKVTLKWEKVSGAVKYEIWRATSKTGIYSKMYTTSSLSYTNSTAKAGTTYYYKVRAINAKGAPGAFSDIVTRTCDCAKPVVKVGNNADTGKITLKWSAVDGAAKYEIYRATSKTGTYSKMYTTSNTSYTNTTSVPAKTYYYKVKAISASKTAADSAFSDIVARTCDCAKPSVAIGTSGGHPYLKWNAVDGADEYVIYRATSRNGSFEEYHVTSLTHFTNSSAKAGVTYYYKVMAVSNKNSSADSAMSKTVSVKAR